MNFCDVPARRFSNALCLFLIGLSTSACSKDWKEEALLHDGGIVVVERSVARGGRHELFKGPPIKEQRLRWNMPGTHETVTWEDKFSEDVGSATLMPMLVDVVQDTAYVVASPMGCLAYNKWGRPNPPYVVFRYEGKEWRRIPLSDLPAEIKTPNLIFSQPDVEAEKIGKRTISAKTVQQIVGGYFRLEDRVISREPIAAAKIGCMEEIRTADGWLSLDWFSSQKTRTECLQLCERKLVSDQDCPCNNIFGRE